MRERKYNRIAITNLGKYNEGTLAYKWLDLPFTETELEDALQEIGVGDEYEEVFISDYEFEFDYEIGEYEDLETLNEMFQKIDEFDSEFYDVANAYFSIRNNDLQLAIDVYENGEYIIYNDCSDMSEVAEQVLLESGELNSIPDHLQRYFDYEAYGRDMDLEGDFYMAGSYVVELTGR